MKPDALPRGADYPATVLLAEDEPLVRFAMAEAFRDQGMEVIACTTGDEALEVLLAGMPVDALVTDVRMPGRVDGLDLARQAKGLRPTLPVIVMSGDALPAEARDADAFLRKPLVEEHLSAAVERLVAHARAAG